MRRPSSICVLTKVVESSFLVGVEVEIFKTVESESISLEREVEMSPNLFYSLGVFALEYSRVLVCVVVK